MTKSRKTRASAAAPATDPAGDTHDPSPAPAGPKGKIGAVVALLRGPQGASIAEIQAATGWQAHSVRGAISGAIKKKLGLKVISEKAEVGRVYRIVEEAGA